MWRHGRRGSLTLALFLLSLLACVQELNAEYPAGALRCKSSLTRPDNQLICPQGRNVYCVKEVSSLKQDLCGKTQYFGDTYHDEECVYKKCAAQCVEGEYQFNFGGNNYTRRRFCCNDAHLCNDAPRSSEIGFGTVESFVHASFLVLSTLFLAF